MKREFVGAFLGFLMDGRHSAEFDIVRINTGNRATLSFSPNFKDTTVEVAGMTGLAYFDTQLQQLSLTIDFGFDSVTETTIRALKNWMRPDKLMKLRFDEMPFKEYTGKIQSPPKFSYIAFNESKQGNGPRIYKGEGQFQFVCYYPWARAPHQRLSDYFMEAIGEENMYVLDYPSVDGFYIGKKLYKERHEWIDASGLIGVIKSYTKVAAGTSFNPAATYFIKKDDQYYVYTGGASNWDSDNITYYQGVRYSRCDQPQSTILAKAHANGGDTATDVAPYKRSPWICAYNPGDIDTPVKFELHIKFDESTIAKQLILKYAEAGQSLNPVQVMVLKVPREVNNRWLVIDSYTKSIIAYDKDDRGNYINPTNMNQYKLAGDFIYLKPALNIINNINSSQKWKQLMYVSLSALKEQDYYYGTPSADVWQDENHTIAIDETVSSKVSYPYLYR